MGFDNVTNLKEKKSNMIFSYQQNKTKKEKFRVPFSTTNCQGEFASVPETSRVCLLYVKLLPTIIMMNERGKAGKTN